MNLRQALYMKTIAEKGGITAAAKQLYISQPSLSQMLRQIEEEAGVPLFDRSSLSFRPTYAGERYLHAASVLLNTNEILENELREETSLTSFVAGFQLGLGIARELEPYSFEDEEENRATERVKMRYSHIKN